MGLQTQMLSEDAFPLFVVPAAWSFLWQQEIYEHN